MRKSYFREWWLSSANCVYSIRNSIYSIKKYVLTLKRRVLKSLPMSLRLEAIFSGVYLVFVLSMQPFGMTPWIRHTHRTFVYAAASSSLSSLNNSTFRCLCSQSNFFLFFTFFEQSKNSMAGTRYWLELISINMSMAAELHGLFCTPRYSRVKHV